MRRRQDHPTAKGPSGTVSSQRSKHRWQRLIAAAAAGAALILAIVALWPTAPLPGDAITSADPRVRALYEQARLRVRAEPEFAQPWADLGLAFAAHGHMAAAVECLARATALGQDDWRWPCLQAAIEAEAGDVQRAAETVSEAIRRDPRQQWPRLVRARWLETLGREAEPLYRGILAESADHPAASLGLARLLFGAGRVDEAAALVVAARTHPSTRRGAHELLARIEGRRGKAAAAEAAATAARALPADMPWPSDPFPPALAAWRVGKRDLLEEILDYEEAGKTVQAKELSAVLLASHPEVGLLLKGRQLLAQGDAAAAEREFRKARELDPRWLELNQALGTAVAAQGRLVEAVEIFRGVIAVEPSYAPAWTELARCLDATDPAAAREARDAAARYARGTPSR